MKRDLALVRNILFVLEDIDDFPVTICDIQAVLDGVTTNSIYAHLEMLESAGLIDGKDISSAGDKDYLVKKITSAGHDYIDMIRNDTVFKKAIKHINDHGLPLALGVLQDICSQLLLGKL